MKLLNKILNVKKLILRLWIVLWLVLIIFVVAKLCFNLWYPIIVEDENIIKICNFVDEHEKLKISILAIFYTINGNLMFLIFTKKKKCRNILIFTIMSIVYFVVSIIKYYYNFVGIIFEILIIILSTIINIKKRTFNKNILNIFYAIIVYLIINLWQMNILFIRGIQDNLSSIPTLIGLVMQLDYYIFLIITWIGVNYMGAWGFGWLWGKSKTELEALKAEELKKANPDKKLLSQIDKRLEELNNEVKN